MKPIFDIINDISRKISHLFFILRCDNCVKEMRLTINWPPYTILIVLIICFIVLIISKKFFSSWIGSPQDGGDGIGFRASVYDDGFRPASKGEASVHRALKEMFPHYTFKKRKPSWLINPKTGKRLELDFFNELLMLAVEYNGIQHYAYTKRFHVSHDDFLRQVERDEIKASLCKNHNVLLVVIPHTVESVRDIKDFISNAIMNK